MSRLPPTKKWERGKTSKGKGRKKRESQWRVGAFSAHLFLKNPRHLFVSLKVFTKVIFRFLGDDDGSFGVKSKWDDATTGIL